MPETRPRTKRLVRLAAIVILGIIGREFFNAFYVFSELVVVLSLVALGVFFASGLMVLAIVSHAAWRHVTTYMRKIHAPALLQEVRGATVSRTLVPRGVYERENRIKA